MLFQDRGTRLGVLVFDDVGQARLLRQAIKSDKH